MAVRIYSLAKDLGLDSKELVDLCTRLGILNKGSALASVDDEEIARVNDHLRRSGEIFEDHIKQSPTHVRWSRKGVSILPESLTNSKEIVELDLSFNKVGLSENSVERISKLVSLTSLNLAENSIGVLPESFGKLVNLEVLDLSGNRISTLPKSLGRLKRLKTLRIARNTFSNLPDFLSELEQLACLDVSGNQLLSVPIWISKLQSLSLLSISQNKLETLPNEVTELAHLVELRINENMLTKLPDSIGRCRSLKILLANNNSVGHIPKDIAGCGDLEKLELKYNKIQNVPDEIGLLPKLQTLHLSNNNISSLPDSIGSLTSLENMDLSGNRLVWLPVSTQRLLPPTGMLTEISLHDNPELRIPAEILERKSTEINPSATQAASVLKFYFRRQSGPSRKLREAKILLVGQGGVGKSSIAKHLLDPNFILNRKESQTNGIAILEWCVAETPRTFEPKTISEKSIVRYFTKRHRREQAERLKVARKAWDEEMERLRKLPPVRVNVWDFGGQEIMHSTHQFFLTQRSLYLLVLDARSGEHEGNLHEWLKTIQGFGGSSPVLLVINKCEPPHNLQLDVTRLKLDYSPNLVGIYYVSCESKQGIGQLRAAVEQQVLHLPHVNDELPETYFDVKSEMELLAESEDFITQDRYKVVCQKNQIHDDDSQRILLQFLHDLGSVLHYDDPRQHYLVYDTNVLNPEWVTNGVYKILMNHELRANGDGKVLVADFEKLLGDPVRYPRERHRFLIDLMRKFDLCFALSEDSGQLLVPELLSPNEPDIGWDIGEYLNFQFHYSVLPRGLMPRFIVRTHHLLTKHPTYWRAGVVLEIEGCRVAVRGDGLASIMYIQIQGVNTADRRRALSVVRDHFGAIHSSMPRLAVEAKIPLPGEPEAPPVSFNHLCRLERMGQDLYWFEGSEKQWSIRELLHGTVDREYDVFLCHNKLDKPAAKMLSGILRERNIRAWLDVNDLTPGKPWQAEIAEAISFCRSVAVLMGPSGAGIWQVEEVRLALSEAATLKKIVIPLILPGMNMSKIDLPAEYRYLKQRTWVVFEDEFDEENIEKLCKGIKS